MTIIFMVATFLISAATLSTVENNEALKKKLKGKDCKAKIYKIGR